MVQMSELTEIEQTWRAKGEPYCEHNLVDDEYYLGSRTGDRGCLNCGDHWPKGEPSDPRGNRI
ncbi:hypothetical protein QE416_002007 [Microbacterium sp. SORGH_AS 421]|nr:hypothetical protein [Microbacterium sp. SORGH_AS_0421]